MKILYFYQYFTTPKGSYNTRVYEFTRRWAQAGHQVTVITSWFDRSDLRPTQFLTKLTIDGVEVRVMNIGLSNKHGVLHRLYTFSAYALVACWYALVHSADVVVASSGPITVGLPALVARYIRRRPLIFEVRDLWPEGAIQMGYVTNPWLIRMARALENACYGAAVKIVALSEGMASWIKGRYGHDHVEVVPNASDNQLFATQQDNAGSLPPSFHGKKLVVYAGNLGPGDDCGQLLDMAKILRDHPSARDVEVVLVGDGKQGPYLRQRAQDEGLPVRFLGLIPREELVPFLMHAHCSVFATKNLPFYDTCSPNKFFDALAAGVPVVQTTQGWIKNLMEREHCGITVPQNDPTAFAEAVLRVVNNPRLRYKLGASARRLARQQFDRELLSARMLDLVVAAARNKGVVTGAALRHPLNAPTSQSYLVMRTRTVPESGLNPIPDPGKVTRSSNSEGHWRFK